MDDAQLQTVWRQRQIKESVSHLSGPLAMLMKHTLGKRVRQLGALAEVWDELIPQGVRDHTALESFSAGVLTVIVDSAPHRFHLQTLLAGGVQAQLQQQAKVPLNKVRLVPGQFASIDLSGSPRYVF
jgi:hypothetical protein